MAVQGKGILGNPKGIIGSINCITRYNQGILQGRATISNPYSRRWNLLKWQLTQKITYSFNQMPAYLQATWGFPESNVAANLEACLNFNLLNIYKSKLDTVLNSVLVGVSGAVLVQPSFHVKKASNIFSLDLSDDNGFFALSGTKYIQIFYGRPNQSYTQWWTVLPPDKNTPFIIDMSPPARSIYTFIGARFQTSAPALFGQYLLLDLYAANLNLP